MAKNKYFKTQMNYKSYVNDKKQEESFEYKLKKAIQDGDEKYRLNKKRGKSYGTKNAV